MPWRTLAEYAAVGFLSHGTLSVFFTRDPLAVAAAALAGLVVGFAFPALRNLPYQRYFHNATSACVAVHPTKLVFGQVSTKAPEKMAYIRIQHMKKSDLFKRLDGKRINPDTIPFHMRVKIEQRGHLDLPWEAVEPILRPL